MGMPNALAGNTKGENGSARLRNLERQFKKNPSQQKLRIALGEALFEENKYQRVIEVLQPKMELLPRTSILLIARSYQKLKDHLNEIRVYKHLTTMNAKDYRSFFELGNAYSQSKNPEEAILAFRKAIEIQPTFRPAYEALAIEYKRTGNNYENRVIIEDMIKNFGAKPEYLAQLCRLYTLEKYKDTAIAHCNEAIKKQPNNPSNHVYLGLNYKNSGDAAQAKKILVGIAKQFPQSEQAQWEAGQISEESKNFLAAFQYYKQATEADSKSFRAYLGLARSAFELKKYNEALNAFVKACPESKEASEEFRRFTYRLRHSGETIWHAKYLSKLPVCN
jgi:tetratricopeptide (TPR) repeat protein